MAQYRMQEIWNVNDIGEELVDKINSESSDKDGNLNYVVDEKLSVREKIS